MKKLISLLFSFLAFIFVFFITPTPAHALEASIQPNPPGTLNENTVDVKVTFSGIPSGDYWVCYESSGNDCDSSGDFHEVTVSGGNITVNVCPVDDNTLTTSNCDSHWFEANHTYHVRLFTDVDFAGSSTSGRFVSDAEIRPQHYYPEVELITSGSGVNTDLTVRITGLRRPFFNGNRNNYQVSFEGVDGTEDPPDKDQCVTVPEAEGFAEANHVPLVAGNYRIDISEQVDEGTSGCADGFVYASIYTKIAADGTVTVEKIDYDPQNSEGGINDDDPNSPREAFEGRNPCEGGSCETAFGTIPTDISGFASTFLSIAVGIAGGIAFILMVIGSVRVLLSSGDPKALGAGRDMIIGAVAGLLFLIFSTLILRLVGISILSGIV